MFKVTVGEEVKEWHTLEYALTDVLSRGYSTYWKLEKVKDD